MKNNDPVKKLRKIAQQLFDSDDGLMNVAEVILSDERFKTYPASIVGHQDYEGGLAQHTYEVVSLCMSNRKELGLDALDMKEAFFGALFHDSGKMYDYARNGLSWAKTEHNRYIHHISRSGIIWSHAIKEFGCFDDNVKYHDAVLHIILSHHGQREWGSPVMPKSQAAWLVHLCDCISARMDDYNKLDLVHKHL